MAIFKNNHIIMVSCTALLDITHEICGGVCGTLNPLPTVYNTKVTEMK